MKLFFARLMSFFRLSFACLFVFTVSCGSDSPDTEDETPALPPVNWETAEFKILKGLNIGGWLSQTSSHSIERERFFTKTDVKKLADWGFDHIRLPIDESEVFTESGEWNAKALKLMHDAIGWSKEQNMRVILDFHILRSHYFNDTENMTLWKDKNEQEKFINMWVKISDEFKKYPNSLLAYEILNEPVPSAYQEWNSLLTRVVAKLRMLEPDRMLVLDPGSHSSISQLKNLEIPENDKNLILSVHFYTPHLITHYQAPWMDGLKNLSIPLHYPGQLVAQADYDTISITRHKEVVRYYNGYYDKNVLKSRLQEAIDISTAKGLQLHIGEIGCIDKTPTEIKHNWYRDVVSILKENNIAFSIWGYKSNFGILTDYGSVKDKTLIDIITE